MPEAVMMCIDSSDYMRNGDYHPSRMLATIEACNLLAGHKMQSNPENMIGFLTMGGAACTVRETLTADIDRIMASLTTLAPGGGTHFFHGLQIASLALSHTTNPRAEKRVVAFVGSPVHESPEQLEKLAKRLRKDDVAVDIVCYGDESNNELLQNFVSTASKNNNSHFVFVPIGAGLHSALARSAIFLGEDGAAAQAASGGMGGGPGGPGGNDFGVDPNMDPELAMVLRMSLEEERQRQAAAQGGGGGGAAPAQDDASKPATDQQQQQPTEKPLTEEEEFELALKLSADLAEKEAKEQAGPSDASAGPSTTTDTADPDKPPQQQQAKPNDDASALDAALNDAEFMDQLAKDIEGKKDDSKKDEGGDKGGQSK